MLLNLTKAGRQILKTMSLLLLIIVMLAALGLAHNVYKQVAAFKQVSTSIEQQRQKYFQAVDLLAHAKWSEANQILAEIKDYSDAKVLTAYAKTRIFLQQQNFSAALQELKQIPQNYQGQFQAQIARLRRILP